jgi:hypothetical protein
LLVAFGAAVGGFLVAALCHMAGRADDDEREAYRDE